MHRTLGRGKGAALALLLAAVAGMLAVAAVAAQSHAQIEGTWARAASAGTNSAVYMHIVNHGPDDLIIVGAAADVAERVEIHQTTMEMAMVDGRLSQVMRMEHVPELVVPAGSAVELAPGGLHVMLITLTRELEEGDAFELTLFTKDGGAIAVHVPVTVFGPAAMDDHGHHDH